MCVGIARQSFMVIGTTRSTHAPNLFSDQVVSDRALNGYLRPPTCASRPCATWPSAGVGPIDGRVFDAQVLLIRKETSAGRRASQPTVRRRFADQRKDGYVVIQAITPESRCVEESGPAAARSTLRRHPLMIRVRDRSRDASSEIMGRVRVPGVRQLQCFGPSATIRLRKGDDL
jgi:hypothetical protein